VMYPLSSVGSAEVTGQGRGKLTQITRCVIATLALGLSACTNPYDPVQRGFAGGLWGAASGAAIGAAAGGGPGAALGAAVGGATGIVGGVATTSAPTRYLLWLPGLWIFSWLRVSGLRLSRLSIPTLPAARLRISRLFGCPWLSRSPDLWIPGRRGIRRSSSTGLRIPRRRAISY
jgi:hypothetical protein